MDGLNKLGQDILRINRANGFGEMTRRDWDQAVDGLALNEAKYRIPAVLALIHSEVSEALEEFRKEYRLDKFGEELADVLIRTLDCAAALEIDIDAVVAAKLEKNRGRGHKHGGRLI